MTARMHRISELVVSRLERMPLTWRLIAILLAILLAALTTTAVATAFLLQRDLEQNVDDQLRAVAIPIAEDRTSSARDPAFYERRARSGPTNFFLLRQPADGSSWEYQAPTGVDIYPDVPPLAPDSRLVQTGVPFTVDSVDGDMRWRVIAGRYTDNSTFAVGMSLAGVNQTMQWFTVVSTVVGLVAVVAGGILGWYATRRAFRPLRRIEDTAAAIAAGDLARRVPVRSSHDEVASLSDSLNSMLVQIERSFGVQEASELKMRQFVADASHELRTPLATVRGYAELYRQGAVQDTEHVGQAMDRIEGEARRMGGLVEDLLILARLDDDQRPLEWTDIDLVVLCAETVHDARVRMPERSISLAGLDGELEPVTLRGDDSRLRQVLGNLLANALMHTDEGIPVEVATGHDGRTAVLEVRDHGAGIDPVVAEKVFERFYRVDKARSRARGGSGLGLAIVAAIVDQHDGTVSARTTPGGGATFRVEIPTAAGQRSTRP